MHEKLSIEDTGPELDLEAEEIERIRAELRALADAGDEAAFNTLAENLDLHTWAQCVL